MAKTRARQEVDRPGQAAAAVSLAEVSGWSGNTAVAPARPVVPVRSWPRPWILVPVGQSTTADLYGVALVGLVAETRTSPGRGLAQIANASTRHASGAVTALS